MISLNGRVLQAMQCLVPWFRFLNIKLVEARVNQPHVAEISRSKSFYQRKTLMFEDCFSTKDSDSDACSSDCSRLPWAWKNEQVCAATIEAWVTIFRQWLWLPGAVNEQGCIEMLSKSYAAANGEGLGGFLGMTPSFDLYSPESLVETSSQRIAIKDEEIRLRHHTRNIKSQRWRAEGKVEGLEGWLQD